MNVMLRGLAAGLTAVLLLAACSSAGENTEIAARLDGEPVPTTPPLAIPLDLSQVGVPSSDQVAETAPLELPPTATPTSSAATAPTVEPPAETSPTAVPPTAMPPTAVATAVPAEAAATTSATPVPATAIPATPVPAQAEATATTAPAAESQATPEATQPPVAAAASGPAIALGDFDVVNLATGATQNIAQLSPSGPTVLWFWAPH